MTTDTELNELPKTFSPEDSQNKWYDIWEKSGAFKPRQGKRGETYCIIMPPPNVTGRLHAGHALDATTQDILTRFKRMKGYETLWLPGMDHAGIATQSVVEKMVYDKEKKTRHDFTREEFLKKIWEWKDEYGGIIANQQRAIGASADWNYALFTMDKNANDAVKKAFVDYYNEGLIYQADYIVNWDPELRSAISDAEVEHKEVVGAFYHILYKVVGSAEQLEIATTRPETMLGDTAVAVNPNDDRFKHLIGKKAIVPIIDREVPIIGDTHVDIEKGTGCLKVTPGHDFNDFEIGKRHNLKIVNILNEDCTLNNTHPDYQGLSCQDARKKILEKLTEQGLLVKTESHTHQVGHGERSGIIIEPRVSKQWFLNVQEMAKVAVAAVEKDQTKFYPKSWENTYFAWIREPKNWCISRQLWWGHRIPVFTCSSCKHSFATEDDHPSKCPKCSKANLIQDPDVLDTWFSSGLWPLSTLGWPSKERMKEKGFDRFYPTSTLVTGYDIIFFWVARMMMMCIKSYGDIPFKHVYNHALIRDKHGRKMSKSLGNGIDPLEMIQKYGADALRFTLAAGSGYNRGLNLDPERIEGYRNFVNKIWNAFRFISPFLNESDGKVTHNKLDHHERWVLSELNSVTKIMNESTNEYRFDDACAAVYSFVYDKFCSWFIELSKPILHGEDIAKKKERAAVLKFTFKKTMALLHPFIPYITEDIWDKLKDKSDSLLISYEYPEFDEKYIYTEDQEQMNKFIDVVSTIRNLRSSVNIPPKEKASIALFCDDETLRKYFKNQSLGLSEMAKANELHIESKQKDRPRKSIMSATTHTEVFLILDGVVNIDQQLARLNKDLLKTEKDVQKLEDKLSNENFIKNAPPEVLDEVKGKFRQAREKVESLQATIARLK